MKKYLEILKRSPLFHGMDDGDILKILGCLNAKVTSFDKKYTIIAEGTPTRYIGLMLSGVAQIISIDYYGNRSIIGEIGESELFAEAFACAEVEHLPLDIIADSACEVMLIDCSHVLYTCAKHCAHHQQLIFNLMKDIAKKAIMFHQKIDITAKRTTRDKLLSYLSYISKKEKSLSFDIPFDRQGLADYLEVDRSGLSVEIGRMKKEGLIKNKKNHFELIRREL